LTNVYKVAN